MPLKPFCRPPPHTHTQNLLKKGLEWYCWPQNTCSTPSPLLANNATPHINGPNPEKNVSWGEGGLLISYSLYDICTKMAHIMQFARWGRSQRWWRTARAWWRSRRWSLRSHSTPSSWRRCCQHHYQHHHQSSSKKKKFQHYSLLFDKSTQYRDSSGIYFLGVPDT